MKSCLLYAACIYNCWNVCLRVSGRRGRGGGMGMGSSWRWQLIWAMRLALRWCRPCRLQSLGRGGEGTKWRIGRRLLELWSYSKLLLRSLYFNSLTNSDTLLDCVFEPVYWIVDNVTRWFGLVSSGDSPLPLFSPPKRSVPDPSLSLSLRCLSL